MTTPITDELVKEFLTEHEYLYAYDRWKQFLASRQVKDWEITKYRRIIYEGEDGIHTPTKWCENYDCEIWEVRRLPSNEVFTVGEETKEGKIEKFNIQDGYMIVHMEVLSVRYFLAELHKLPSKPVLVTEDNVKIYEGESVYYIGKKSLMMSHCRAGEHLNNAINCGDYLYFSTREAAEKYVKENKLIYSETMIWKALQASPIGGRFIKEFFERLEKQAKP